MKEIPYEAGRAAYSTQGRDKGRLMLIARVLDERTVLVADGDLRKLEKPKRKQIKHLRPLPQSFPELAERLAAGKPLLNSDVRKALATLRTDQEN